MKTNSSLHAAEDINKVVYNILKQSKALDVFPTPVDKIVAFTELNIDTQTNLHDIPNHYISKKIDILASALSKIFGALDRRKKIIYLEPGLMEVKKNFVKLHEVGHHGLPWQKDIFLYVEDEKTLSPEIKETFEAEANFFASASLFQLNRFEDLAKTLPLGIKSARYLAKYFGASVHAALRRYVETINRRCALLVLTKDNDGVFALQQRNYFQSPKFTKEFGEISLPASFGTEWPFVRDFIVGRKVIDSPQPLSIVTSSDYSDFEYQYFNNQYNVFILFTPKGERIASRTTIMMR